MKIFSTSARNTKYYSNYAHARELSAKIMDELLAEDFEELKKGTSINLLNGFTLPRIETKGRTKFHISLIIRDLNPSFSIRHKNLSGFVSKPMAYKNKNNELKKITVTVSWKGVSRDLSYTLSALKADLYN